MAFFDLAEDWHDTRDRPGRQHDWPLMSDIFSARAGIPEHLIRWRRAEGDDDPPPPRSTL